MIKRAIAIIMTIVISVTVVSLVYYLHFVPQHPYQTIKELNDQEVFISTNLSIGRMYKVKDKVEGNYVFALPELKENYSVDANNLSTYTAVWFGSEPSFPVFFIGDRSSDFPVGKEVKFDLEVKKYEIFISGTSLTITSVESAYVYYMILELYKVIYIGNFAIISFELDRIDDVTFKLTVTEIANFNSLPICWSDVYAVSFNSTKPIPSFKVYSSDGSFLGEFRERNASMIGKEVEIGQYLEFTYNKNTYGNLTILLSADIFPMVSSAGDPFFFDQYPISRIDV